MESSYVKRAIALAVSYVLMFLLSMSMVRSPDDYYLNASNAWMAAIMVWPMGMVMMLVMGDMFGNKRLNALCMAHSSFSSWQLLPRPRRDVHRQRRLPPVDDRPPLARDPGVPGIQHHRSRDRRPVTTIVKTQAQETNQMKEILEQY